MTAEVEEREGEQGFGGLEPERDAGDQADLVLVDSIRPLDRLCSIAGGSGCGA